MVSSLTDPSSSNPARIWNAKRRTAETPLARVGGASRFGLTSRHKASREHLHLLRTGPPSRPTHLPSNGEALGQQRTGLAEDAVWRCSRAGTAGTVRSPRRLDREAACASKTAPDRGVLAATHALAEPAHCARQASPQDQPGLRPRHAGAKQRRPGHAGARSRPPCTAGRSLASAADRAGSARQSRSGHQLGCHAAGRSRDPGFACA